MHKRLLYLPHTVTYFNTVSRQLRLNKTLLLSHNSSCTHLISCTQVCEFVLSFWVVRVSVGVQLESQLSVGLFNVPDGCGLAHTQDLVEISPSGQRTHRLWTHGKSNQHQDSTPLHTWRAGLDQSQRNMCTSWRCCFAAKHLPRKHRRDHIEKQAAHTAEIHPFSSHISPLFLKEGPLQQKKMPAFEGWILLPVTGLLPPVRQILPTGCPQIRPSDKTPPVH